MAITYNKYDHIYYGTSAERAADLAGDKEITSIVTAKFYEYDTGSLYVSDGTSWYEIV